jgi:hypothetical protein
MFVAQFSIYVLVLNALACLRVFFAAKKQFARPLCKNTLQCCWKERFGNGDSGQSARIRASLCDCGFSTRLVPVLLLGFLELDDACIVQE